MVVELDAALGRLAHIVSRDLGIDINDIPGVGAAGGLGGGLMAFINGELKAGVDIVLDTVGLDQVLIGADLVITGEGCMDFQTVYRKAPIGVAQRAGNRRIPVIAISGSLGKGYRNVHAHGIDAVSAITCAPMTLDESSERAFELIAAATEEAMRFMKVGGKIFGQV